MYLKSVPAFFFLRSLSDISSYLSCWSFGGCPSVCEWQFRGQGPGSLLERRGVHCHHLGRVSGALSFPHMSPFIVSCPSKKEEHARTILSSTSPSTHDTHSLLLSLSLWLIFRICHVSYPIRHAIWHASIRSPPHLKCAGFAVPA